MVPKARRRVAYAAAAVAAMVAVVVALVLVQPWGGGDGTRPASGPVERLVSVNGQALYLSCQGEGARTVVFDAGLGDSHRVWAGVIDKVGDGVRVCAYDRRGVGDSEAGDSPVSSIVDAAGDLRALLAGAGIEPPYVLVSHSIAGLIHRYYAKVYPAEVSGLVMVDTAPDDWDQYRGRTVFRGGGESLDVAAAAVALRASDDLGQRPVVVVEAARTSEISQAEGFAEYWRQAQQALAARSTNSMLVVAADSNHSVPASQPDLVAAAVDLVVDAVGSGVALPTCASSGLAAVRGECQPQT
jgi:pimeloyl-ACP methyl ester carboxylesterase